MSLTANKARPYFKHAEWSYVGEQYYFPIETMFKLNSAVI